MKKSIIFLLLLSLGMIGCQEQGIPEKGIQKPVQTRTITTVKSPYFQWNDTKVVRSKYYGDIVLPWYNTASVQLPKFIIKNYKAEDGWELVYNLISDSPVVEKGKNYLMFYNKFTGTLRVFYNHRSTTGGHGTTFWKIAFDNRSALLNGAGTYYTEPASVRKNSPSTYISNITTVESKSIYIGWNCFDVDMCYDPLQKNEPLQMSISSYSKDESDITLEGVLDLKSKGTIIAGTSNKYSGVLGFVAKGAGSGVDRYVNKLLKDTVNGKPNHNIFKDKIVKALPAIIQGGIPDLLSGGATTLVKAGVNLLFGSFLQRANRPIVQDLKFTTKGTVKIEGRMESSSGSEVVPVANLKVPGTPNSHNDHFMPSFDKPLGVWNLKKKPVFVTSRKKTHIYYYFSNPNNGGSWSDGLDDGWGGMEMLSLGMNLGRDRSLRLPLKSYIDCEFYLDKSSVQVVMNPEVEKILDKYKVDSKLVLYQNFSDNSWPTVPTFRTFNHINGDLLYNEGMSNIYENVDLYPIRPEGKIYNVYSERVFYDNKFPSNEFVVKVTVTLYPKAPYNQDPIIMTRSYIPEYKLVD